MWSTPANAQPGGMVARCLVTLHPTWTCNSRGADHRSPPSRAECTAWMLQRCRVDLAPSTRIERARPPTTRGSQGKWTSVVVTTTDVAQVKVRRPVGLPESPKPGWHARATRWRWMAAPAALALGVRVISLLLADLALRMLVAAGAPAPSRSLGLIESWRVHDPLWCIPIAQ